MSLDPNKLMVGVAFLTDFEVILSICVSCLPGMRAWLRGKGLWWKRILAVETVVTTGTAATASGLAGVEEQTLVFMQEATGSYEENK